MLFIYLAVLDSEDERAKMTDIYETHKAAMLRYALSITTNKELAEDAVHNAFMSIITHKEKYFQLSCMDLRACIVIIVKNKCIDLKRQQSRRAYDQLDDMENTLESSDMPVEDQVVLDDEYSALRKCLTALDETSRLVLEMKFVLGMTYKEIGVELGMTANHVDTKIMRAKAKVRKLIAEGGDQNGE